LGLVKNPYPLGTFNPRVFLIIRVGDVLALRLFINEGVLIPNFIPVILRNINLIMSYFLLKKYRNRTLFRTYYV
jgi:hypothetical protein